MKKKLDKKLNKKLNKKIVATAFIFLFLFTACDRKQEDNRTVIKEPGKSLTVIDNENTVTPLPFSITVNRIEKHNKMEITDWLDEQTVILAKENSEFDKMSLQELSEYYPRSIYQYNLDTKDYETLKAKKNMFLGGAKLSPDRKHLLYYEYSIGDTAYYLMNMDENESSSIKDEVLGLAMSANWANDNKVIGVSYAGGAYIADADGNMTQIEELQELQEQLYTVKKYQDKIYYITSGETLQLHVLDLNTKENKNLNIENADGIIPSPDGKQLLITQWDGPKQKLLVADAEGTILKTIAEGTEITGVSWSPDQKMIAYQLNSVVNGADSSGRYLYDVMAGNSMQIAVNIGNGGVSLRWSPSSDKIAVSQYEEGIFNSSIIYLDRDAN